MNELVRIKGNDVFTDSIIIANETGNEHESIVKNLKKYLSDFTELGEVRFTDLKSGNPLGGRPTRVYELNEPQATLLITYLDNTKKVRAFKLALVKEFYRMRQFLMQRSSAEWQETRQKSKTNRLRETDEIKNFVTYADANGSKNAKKYYTAFTNLANKAVGLSSKQRDIASFEILQILSIIENTIRHIVAEELQKATEYHLIYFTCKDRVSELMKHVFLPERKSLLTA